MPENFDSHRRYGCSHHHCLSHSFHPYNRTLGSIWHRAPSAIHSCAFYCTLTGCSEIKGSPYVPCLYRLWYCVFFANRGKKTAWNIWKTFDNLTEAFHSVIVDPDTITEEVLSIIEHFTVLLYNRTSLLSSVDAGQMELFVKKGRGMEDMPPTKDALMLHFKRSVFRVHIAGALPSNLHQSFPLPQAGVGLIWDNGILCGLRFLRQVKLPVNCCVVAAKMGAEKHADVWGPL